MYVLPSAQYPWEVTPAQIWLGSPTVKRIQNPGPKLGACRAKRRWAWLESSGCWWLVKGACHRGKPLLRAERQGKYALLRTQTESRYYWTIGLSKLVVHSPHSPPQKTLQGCTSDPWCNAGLGGSMEGPMYITIPCHSQIFIDIPWFSQFSPKKCQTKTEVSKEFCQGAVSFRRPVCCKVRSCWAPGCPNRKEGTKILREEPIKSSFNSHFKTQSEQESPLLYISITFIWATLCTTCHSHSISESMQPILGFVWHSTWVLASCLVQFNCTSFAFLGQLRGSENVRVTSICMT